VIGRILSSMMRHYREADGLLCIKNDGPFVDAQANPAERENDDGRLVMLTASFNLARVAQMNRSAADRIHALEKEGGSERASAQLAANGLDAHRSSLLSKAVCKVDLVETPTRQLGSQQALRSLLPLVGKFGHS
jgi:hypothetical protein